MHSPRSSTIAAAALVASFVLGPAAVGAQITYDHLKCFKIADPHPNGFSLADLNPEQMPPFAAQMGCKIKYPAQLFCIDVQKTNVTPTPPSTVAGQTTRDFLCYRLVCPTVPNMPLAVEDQFGPRTVVVKQPKVVCVPAIKTAYPQPTPTPCVPPTPTPTATPCPKQCIGGVNNGQPCMTASNCPGGVCTVPMCCCAATGVPACTVNADCVPYSTYCHCP